MSDPGAPMRLPGPVRDAAAKLVAAGAVEGPPTMLRGGYASEVLASGRRLPVLVVVSDGGELLATRCPCGERTGPGTACRHAAALLLSVTGGGAPRHVQLAASPFTLAARSLHEQGSAPAHAPSRAPGSIEILSGSRDCGLLLDVQEAAMSLARVGLLLAAYPPELPGLPPSRARGIVATRMQALRRLVTTPEEAALEVMGARTLARTWEESSWHRLAGACFDLFEERGPRLAWREGRLVLEASRPGEASFTAWLPSLAVEQLLGDAALCAASGLARSAEELRPCVRLEPAADGGLVLEPALQGGDVVVRRSDLAGRSFGRHVFLPSGLLATTARGKPMFAEPSAKQPSLALDESYRPSPFGVSLERRTLVPESRAAAFLARHREEIARLPESLVDEALRNVEALSGPLDVRLTLGGSRDGLVEVTAALLLPDGTQVAIDEVRQARREGRAHLRKGRSWIATADPSLAWIDALPAPKGRSKGPLRLAPLELLRLRQMVAGRLELQGDAGAATQLDRIAGTRSRTDPPADAGTALFPFQRTGLDWLWFLWSEGLGGLLCDDMGLGKTHQAIALLRARTLEVDAPPLRALVVCPASVVPHWADKLAALLPGAKVELHHGARRGRSARESTGATVVVTSYATARNDVELLRETPFDIVVLDEVQSIKNRGTATHQAVASLRRRIVIGLTGTPVENSVTDLETLMGIVVPGYLPPHDEFQRTIGDPADAGDPAARARLARLVHPFVLRRTKAQVLTDLPEKIVDRRACDLTPLQKELYARALGKAAAMRDALEGPGPVPYIHVFALMSRLKQICNHPSLVGSDPAPGEAASGKWELFCELLDEAMCSGHKVVVFSQYVRMLAIVERHLESVGIGFATIKGSTRDRRAPVARFRDDPACRVFSASLRAAGLGLDLTAASVVIMYDRWWNQAWEDQAVDRVHRIGQKRGVQVVKLVTRGSIEERIEALIERKGELASDLVREDAPTLAKRFTREELRALLAE